jgi:hypothetical protein
VNADDLGLSKGVNYGILDAFETGIVSSASLLMNMSTTDHAVKLFENKKIGIGVHLNVTLGKPLKYNPCLVDDHGFFHKKQDVKDHTLEWIIEEFECQIKSALETKLNITHLDSHHHIHMWNEDIFLASLALSKKYGLKIRCDKAYAYMTHDRIKDVSSTEAFSQDFYDEKVHINHLIFILERYLSKESLEMMVHPGFLCGGLIERDSYREMRVVEHSILTSQMIKDFLKAKKIQLIHFGQL